MSLYRELVKLASDRPEFRRHLVPILRAAAAEKTFEDKVKGKKFKNPETGNQVAFDSLPAAEQKKIRQKFDAKGEKEKPAGGQKLMSQDDLVDSVHSVGGVLVDMGMSKREVLELSKNLIVIDAGMRSGEVDRGAVQEMVAGFDEMIPELKDNKPAAAAFKKLRDHYSKAL